MPCVGTGEFHEGLTEFCRVLNHALNRDEHSGSWNTFNQYLGEHPTHFPDEQPPFYEMSEKAHQKLQMLLGPHGHTLAMAWLAQHPIGGGT